MNAFYNRASFIKSVAKLNQLPKDEGYEVAFAGRSNAGKSSALNCLTQQRQLAKTSKTPGRTQLINLFQLDEHRRLVDLPGYGYAKVPIDMKIEWQKTLAKYLETRLCLKGLILLSDIRHPLKALDQIMIEWAVRSKLPIHILLTKSDKLKKGAAKKSLLETSRICKDYHSDITIQMFSSLNNSGLDECYHVLDEWFELGAQNKDR